MDCLFKEQEDGLGNMDPFEEGFEEDPEPEPEWADSDIEEVIPTVTSQSKRNLLFEVTSISLSFSLHSTIFFNLFSLFVFLSPCLVYVNVLRPILHCMLERNAKLDYSVLNIIILHSTFHPN